MIDGGIKHHNSAMVSEWGIDVAVVGSGLINDKASIADNLAEINSVLGSLIGPRARAFKSQRPEQVD